MNITKLIEDGWYQNRFWLKVFRPVSNLASLIAKNKRSHYLELIESGIEGGQQKGKTYRSKLPVIVVGNITAGGTGKTPLVVGLVHYLKEKGLKPAILTRGYKSELSSFPHIVQDSDAGAVVGDEPRLLASRCNVPVVVDPVRSRSAKWVEQNLTNIDCLVLDDGLQHYGIYRDIEIAVVDGERGFGNLKMLPEGPLREGISRLNEVDLVVVNNSHGKSKNNKSILNLVTKYNEHVFEFDFSFNEIINCATGKSSSITALSGLVVDGLAGIGNPDRFKSSLESNGFSINRFEPFPDHYQFKAADLESFNERPLIMTEKDFVKIKQFSRENWWYLPVELNVGNDFWAVFDGLVKKRVSQ